MFFYPKTVVWYIETRPWSGTDTTPGFAPEAASRMGSGVVVALEHLDSQGRPLQPPKIRKYLLTCGHVLRGEASNRASGCGSLFEEILCWQPGRGYNYTAPNGRQSGLHPTGWRAKVAAISPCGGQPGEIPESNRQAALDWALLDLVDESFQLMPAVEQWRNVGNGEVMRIAGYGGGAGDVTLGRAGRLWQDGQMVESVVPEGFRQIRIPPAGMLVLEGPDEARPGMSGGGVFGINGDLLGIHRSSTDIALTRSAISAAFIKTWLAARSIRPALSAVVIERPSIPDLTRQPPDPDLINQVSLGRAPRIPFLNRNKLRNLLNQLLENGNEYKLLTLNGLQGTGKTFSWHLIRHAARAHYVIPVFLDLSQVQTIDGACISIAEQMGLDLEETRKRVLVDDPSEARVGVKMAKWLAEATSNRRPEKWWLVLDNLNSALPQMEEDLLRPLLASLAKDRRLTQLVLVVLGKELPSDPLLDDYRLDDNLEGLRRADVEAFAVKFADSLGKTLRPEEIAEITTLIASDWVGPFTPVQMKTVWRQAKFVMEKLAQ